MRATYTKNKELEDNQDLDLLNLPPRSKKHKSSVKKERNSLFVSQIILRTLLTLFIFLIFLIPFAYYYWLQ
ncbi:hypothetical protein E3U55_03790 [Filobacillus milosensis]|uniref:Uncharacterized protein n=1 Tax=Filobacillus milosensis TaxID=94137 RepID=A0A4Y8IQW7_9BACI|nr:hypothetical protein [Filobacillus milosensis]TFB23946.1 hypothetical protein E3U55_03790 [Filobacillus milosensis]